MPALFLKNMRKITGRINKNKIEKRVFFFLIILIAFCLISLIFIFFKIGLFEKNAFMITENQKKEIIQYAYNVLDKKFGGNDILFSENNFSIEKKYDRIFITFLNNGEIRCCQGGYAVDSNKTVKEDIEIAVEKCIKDKRFGGVLRSEEIKSLAVVTDILYNEQEVSSKNLKGLEKEIELGINAIKIVGENSSAYFKASVPIEKRYSLKKTLERLCEKAKLDKNCYTDENVSLYKYDSMSFKSARSLEIVDLYRNSVLVDIEKITPDVLEQSILAGYNWFSNHIDFEKNILNYLYYSNSGAYSKDDNHVRRMAATWAVSKLSSFYNKDNLRPLVESTLDYYLKNSVKKNNIRYINIDEPKLAYNAFAILAMIDQKNYPDRNKIMAELAGAILNQQRQDGSFSTIFEKDSNKSVDYYPGEAMLSLMELYLETGEEKYAEAVEKAFPYYRDYWRNNKNTAFIPWQTQTYKLLFDKTGNNDLSDFVFEMNDWLIDNYQQFSNQYVDYIGGFKSKPGASTSAYLEGLADAYLLAKEIGDLNHIKKYEESCKNAVRFVLQTQFKKDDTFYVTDIQKTLGGFKMSPLNISLRTDSTQHAVLGLLKVYKSDLFAK